MWTEAPEDDVRKGCEGIGCRTAFKDVFKIPDTIVDTKGMESTARIVTAVLPPENR